MTSEMILERAMLAKLQTWIIGGCLASAAFTQANAISSGCAVVIKTPDGFVAMRARPTVNSPIVQKFAAGQLLGVAWSVGWRGWARVDYVMRLEGGRLISTELPGDGYISGELVTTVDCN
jgi:hypothetical protein